MIELFTFTMITALYIQKYGIRKYLCLWVICFVLEILFKYI